MKCQRKSYVAEYVGWGGTLTGSFLVNATNSHAAIHQAYEYLEGYNILPVESLKVRLKIGGLQFLPDNES